MARHRRNIEEEFSAIAPPGYRGIPGAQPIAVGIAGGGGADSMASFSRAASDIAQLETQFRQQVSLIQAHTQSLQSSSSGGGGDFLGGGLNFLSPVVSGLLSLFGVGSKSAPAPLPFYVAPPSVQIGDTLRSVTSTGSTAAPNGGVSQSSTASTPQVTVNVSAMDSQSFMDRSADIASAVREAMLNLHPINDVVASL
jgi:hypothetical protein